MVVLCSNRPEGFGPHSALHPALPTACFLDVIVAPLATWIYLALALGLLLPLRIARRRRSGPSLPAGFSFKPDDGGAGGRALDQGPLEVGRGGDEAATMTTATSTTAKSTTTTKTSKSGGDGGGGSRGVRIAAAICYWVLVVAMLAMVSLEIARLTAAQLGLGLLPFSYVGIVFVAAERATASLGPGLRRHWSACRAARAASVLFWLMLAAAMALKTAANQLEQMHAAVRRTAASSGIQGRYPTSDEVIDDATMAGVALVLACLEPVGWGALPWI